ncbi:MAG: TetR family transcriptional regulator [Sphingomonas sp.]
MLPPIQDPPRLRNAAATRQAILASARRHFARDSYENVGLREIAGDAGIDPALIGRYFGSKEQLFAEAVRGEDRDMLQDIPRERLADHLAALLTDESRQDCGAAAAKIDKLLILLRSASSPHASQIIREAMSEDMLRPIIRSVGGADAEARASLCLAVLMGVGILRSAMTLDSLCVIDKDLLRRRLTALFSTALADGMSD